MATPASILPPFESGSIHMMAKIIALPVRPVRASATRLISCFALSVSAKGAAGGIVWRSRRGSGGGTGHRDTVRLRDQRPRHLFGRHPLVHAFEHELEMLHDLGDRGLGADVAGQCRADRLHVLGGVAAEFALLGVQGRRATIRESGRKPTRLTNRNYSNRRRWGRVQPVTRMICAQGHAPGTG